MTDQPTPTPRTDAMRLKMTQLGWPADGEPVAMLMASHAELERELSSRTNPHRGSDFKEVLDQERLIPTPRTDDLVPTQGEKQTTYQYILVLEEHARQLERELADAREQVEILRSDEKRLSEFAKTYRLRADEADDKLAAERALADRLALILEPEAWRWGFDLPNEAEEALAAWKEARSESH